jgi:hypothetical protein
MIPAADYRDSHFKKLFHILGGQSETLSQVFAVYGNQLSPGFSDKSRQADKERPETLPAHQVTKEKNSDGFHVRPLILKKSADRIGDATGASAGQSGRH